MFYKTILFSSIMDDKNNLHNSNDHYGNSNYYFSILHLILLLLPSAEGANGFVAEQRDGRHGARFLMLLQLLVNEVVGEVDGGSILFRVAVVYALDMRPIDGTEAHRARLA